MNIKLTRLVVVLIRSVYPRNVGMCARAVANMGAGRLVLIAPRFARDHEEAKQGAANAQDVLANAHVYNSLAAFLAAEGDGLRIALSGRSGDLQRPEDLRDTLDRFKNEPPEHQFHQTSSPIYLLFGPEDDGLANEEMETCHLVCRLPIFGELTSLNLSHAVLLACYVVQSTQVEGSQSMTTDRLEVKPSYHPSETIRRWLLALGFDLTSPRVSIEKTLNRILLSRCPTQEELRILDSVLQQTVRKLVENKPARK